MFLDRYFSFFQKIDWFLTAAVFLLGFFGLAAIYSVALGQGLGEFLNFQKQIAWFSLGAAVFFIFANFDYHYWRKLVWPGYFLGIVLLILVLTPLGKTVHGTQGWFSLGFINFQPVELMKFFLILGLADIYRWSARSISRLSHLAMISLVVLMPLALVAAQPDFGSAMVIFLLWLISLFLIVKKKWQLAVVLIILAAVALAGWFLLQDYQQERFLTFLNPDFDPLGRGYNMRQSLIAVGAGGLFGRGLGFGSQSQLKFIPESQSDFIFAVIAEELGLIGIILILGLFGLIFCRFYRIAVRAPDDFGMFLTILLGILLFIHVFINIGMTIGLLPITGIPLPFVSYGGSFLVVIMMGAGVVLNVNKLSLVIGKNNQI